MPQVIVRVPASTSNLGPGYDCLGVALRLYNDITVSRTTGLRVPPMVSAAARLFFEFAEIPPFPFSCSISSVIPVARGLGSSASVRTGVLHGLNALAGKPLRRQGLFELAARLEGHPDNAAPANFGGFNVARGTQAQRFSVSSRLHFVLLVPDFEIATATARRLLPERLRHLAAVESCGNACAITAAVASENYEKLRGTFVDHLHQPFRKKLIPFFDEALTAGEKAGALGGFLSGSGSTIICLTTRSPHRVAAAMLQAAGSKARTLITTADNRGARLL